MNKINVKCPSCGELFTTEYFSETTCEKCGVKFSVDKGAKFYNSFISVERKKAIEAKGEAYLKVDALLDEVNYYLDNEDYKKAELVCNEILTYTEVDFRVYMAMVLSKTENFTKLDDTSHIPYLKKAIKFASEDEKKDLRARYKTFYEKQNMTEEELEEYNKQHLDYSYSSLEKVLKDGIPYHYQREKSVKICGISSIISLVLTLVSTILSINFENFILYTVTGILSISLLALILSFISNREKVKIFNLALDIFDNFNSFNLSSELNLTVLKEFTEFGVSYLNNSSDLYLSEKLREIITLIKKEENDNITKFLSENKYASKFKI